jgi:hypothetical protein
MRHYILFAQNEPTSNRDVWLIQNVQTGEYVFRSFSVQAARDFLKNLEAAE